MKRLPLIESIIFHQSNTSDITTTTVKELFEFPNFYKMRKFCLLDVSENFDIETFYHLFLKKNKTMYVYLKLNDNISEKYKQKLETIMNQILELKSNEFWPPIIYGPLNYKMESALHSANFKYCKNVLKY
uniref:Uncharacterized protein n=1 Tax=Panagrolaimus davidi TaxID=227884 RepID=A0A914QGS3_9BILA